MAVRRGGKDSCDIILLTERSACVPPSSCAAFPVLPIQNKPSLRLITTNDATNSNNTDTITNTIANSYAKLEFRDVIRRGEKAEAEVTCLRDRVLQVRVNGLLLISGAQGRIGSS